MSVSSVVTAACPACGERDTFSVFHSINGQSRADLRQAVFDDALGVHLCPSCGERARLEPELTYFDMDLGLWIRALDVSLVDDWERLEQETHMLWFSTFGPMASPIAQEVGREVKARVVFGWAALKEKLLCATHGLDDAALEMVKLLALTAAAGDALGDDREWRLAGVTEQALHFEVLVGGLEMPVQAFSMPRAALDSISRSPGEWAEALEEVRGAGFFVDLNRCLVGREAA